MKKVSITEMGDMIKNVWAPLDLFQISDIKVRLVKIKGKYHWHKHTDEDEIFLVIQGEMKIHFKEKEISLVENEAVFVPRNVEHLTESNDGALVMLIEPAGIKTPGD
ncbi:MAG: cupin domain-containing protein [Calditrichaeota bacterium]|nr:cupin domain-containing protein [Calditrichota bacterium]